MVSLTSGQVHVELFDLRVLKFAACARILYSQQDRPVFPRRDSQAFLELPCCLCTDAEAR